MAAFLLQILPLFGFASLLLYSITKNHHSGGFLLLEQATGIEPAFKAWEALILPLNYTRIGY